MEEEIEAECPNGSSNRESCSRHACPRPPVILPIRRPLPPVLAHRLVPSARTLTPIVRNPNQSAVLQLSQRTAATPSATLSSALTPPQRSQVIGSWSDPRFVTHGASVSSSSNADGSQRNATSRPKISLSSKIAQLRHKSQSTSTSASANNSQSSSASHLTLPRSPTPTAFACSSSFVVNPRRSAPLAGGSQRGTPVASKIPLASKIAPLCQKPQSTPTRVIAKDVSSLHGSQVPSISPSKLTVPLQYFVLPSSSQSPKSAICAASSSSVVGCGQSAPLAGGSQRGTPVASKIPLASKIAPLCQKPQSTPTRVIAKNVSSLHGSQVPSISPSKLTVPLQYVVLPSSSQSPKSAVCAGSSSSVVGCRQSASLSGGPQPGTSLSAKIARLCKQPQSTPTYVLVKNMSSSRGAQIPPVAPSKLTLPFHYAPLPRASQSAMPVVSPGSSSLVADCRQSTSFVEVPRSAPLQGSKTLHSSQRSQSVPSGSLATNSTNMNQDSERLSELSESSLRLQNVCPASSLHTAASAALDSHCSFRESSRITAPSITISQMTPELSNRTSEPCDGSQEDTTNIASSTMRSSNDPESSTAERTQTSRTKSSTTNATSSSQTEEGSTNPTSGSRRGGGSKPIQYFHDHRPFKVNYTDKKDENIKFMKCVGKSPLGLPCKATAKLDLANNVWDTTNTLHTCTPQIGRQQVPLFEAYLKRLLSEDRDADIERCYRLASMKYPDGAVYYPYNDSMARKLRQWRAKGDTVHSEPIKNIEELTDYLRRNPEVLDYVIEFEENPEKSYLEFKEVVVDQFRHLIIYDPKLLRRMRDCTTMNVDGTFDELPNLSDVRQLLVFMMQKFGKGFPVIYVLMSRRLTKDYQAIIKAIKEICPELNPTKVITDYEKALRKAFRLEFATIILIACFFHFCQALFRQALKKKVAVRSNKIKQPGRHLILRRFMALALLPAHEIRGALNYIIDDCHADHGIYFDKYIEYFENEYMKVVTPEGFSVHGEEAKTNNKLESCNSYLLRVFGKTPPPNKFIRCLKIVYTQQWLKLLALESPARNGRPVGCSTKKSGCRREEYIKEKWAEHEAGDCTVNDFVIACAKFDDHVDIMYEEKDEASPGQQIETLDDEDSDAETKYLKNGSSEDLDKDEFDSIPSHQNQDLSESCQMYDERTIQERLDQEFAESINEAVDVENSPDVIPSELHRERSESQMQNADSQAQHVQGSGSHRWAIVPVQHDAHPTSAKRKRSQTEVPTGSLKIKFKRIH